MYNEDDFKHIWSETSKDGILHQFYYEHKELVSCQSIIKEAIEYIKNIFKDENWYKNYNYNDLENVIKNILDILQNVSKDKFERISDSDA